VHSKIFDQVLEGVSGAAHFAGVYCGSLRGLRAPFDLIGRRLCAATEYVWKSSVVLGILARDGHGTPKDRKAAYYHFRIALLQGGDNATPLTTNDLRTLSSELGQAQVQALDQEVAAWVQKHNRPLEFVNLHTESSSMFPAYALQYPEKGLHAGLLLGSNDADRADDVPDLGDALR
jgi:TPR repeat protein